MRIGRGLLCVALDSGRAAITLALQACRQLLPEEAPCWSPRMFVLPYSMQCAMPA